MQNKWQPIGKIILLASLIILTLACSLLEKSQPPVKLTQQALGMKIANTATLAPEKNEDEPAPKATLVPTSKPPATESAPPVQVVPTEEDIAKLSVEEEMYTITSIGAAENGASKPTVFTIDESWMVTEIKTYHWNNSQGVAPGQISLKSNDGVTYGPWQATGAEGQGGVVNAYWIVNPEVTIPAGTYTVIDSDPATWSKNDGDTDGMGMSWGRGVRMGNP